MDEKFKAMKTILEQITPQNRIKPSIFLHLPDKTAQQLIKSKTFYNRPIEQHTNLKIINILLELKLIKSVHKFKAGDIICSLKNVEMDIPVFFEAGDHDLEYSGKYWPCGKKRMYYKII